MATINIGRLKPVFQGAYDNAQGYVVDDIVTYSGETYICILASTGNVPTNTTYWSKMASKGADGVDADLFSISGTAQGDLYYNNGSAIARLGAGTSGQVLQTNGTGANPSWVTADAGKTLQLTNAKQSTRVSLPNTGSKTSLMSGTHTQVKASTKLLIHYRFPLWQDTGGSSRTYFDYDGTTYYDTWSWDYTPWGGNTNTWSGHFIFNAPASTGSKNWAFGWHSNNGSNSSPASIFCPNSSDDGRLGQTVGEITIQELDF